VTARPLAPLPVPVRPRHGETAASYIRRLARANYLRPSYLRSLVCSPPQTGVRADLLAAVSGRTARALERTLAGLAQRPGTGPPQILRPPPLPPAAEPGILDSIRRDAAADATVPVRLLAARHRVSRRTVLQALTPPGTEPGNPHPPWPAPPLAPLRPLIDACLAEEPDLPAYQVWERLLDQHGAEISYLSVNAYVTRRRARSNGKPRTRTTVHLARQPSRP